MEKLTEAFQKDDVAIVLIDIMMPEMDGYELIWEIRKQPKYRKLPILLSPSKP
ncbi:response regulator [Candidatus Halobeggiatoa sp. HSG11]|nr:response regulator [Candidatus Halobeggiatoa sp. HSG11]